MFPKSMAVSMLRRSMMMFMIVMVLLSAVAPVAVMAAPAAAPTDSAEQSGWVYYVKSGDSLSKLARRYGVTVSQLARANGLSTTSYLYVGQRLYIPTGTVATSCKNYYSVKRGDTLSKIAAWYGINTSALAQANGISNASYIYVGQRICIPNIYATPGYPGTPSSYGYYTVKYGDTLSRIARYYGVSTWALQNANGIANANYIYVGQVLKIPRY